MLWLRVADRPVITLAVAHLRSKRDAKTLDQLNGAINFAQDIRAIEQRAGHERTVVVGDLNMNPFEPGVTFSRGLNAVSSRTVARRRRRRVDGHEYPFFYNPMWGVLGDRTPGPLGTYYRSAGETVNYFWNVYDQVLLRPDVMDGLEELRVIESFGPASLLTRAGLPDKHAASDHLPLYFRLDWS